VDHQDWGDGWGDGDGDYSGDAETADLTEPDEPLAPGLGGYEDQGGYPPGDAGGEQGPEPAADGGPHAGPGGGFLEDDPMGAFDADSGDEGDSGEPGRAYLTGAGDTGEADGADAGPGVDGAADTGEPDASTEPHPETVVGADPDVDPDADWSPADFPGQLDFAAPEPVDGYPWSDSTSVAAPGTGGEDPAHGPDAAPPTQDLLDYAGADGGGGDPWAALVGSDDPAASSLGRWWAPGS
jgi:hypothetical protein